MKFAIINDLRDAGWEKQALPSNQDRCLLLMNTSQVEMNRKGVENMMTSSDRLAGNKNNMISTQSLDFSARRTARQLQCFLSNIQFDICSKHYSICRGVMDFSFIDGISCRANGFRKYGNIYFFPLFLISAYSDYYTNIYIFLLQMQVTSLEQRYCTSATISGATSAPKFDSMN